MITRSIRAAVHNPWVTLGLFLAALLAGWNAYSNKAVDAIPDISESQVIVTASWPGRSPQDVEDQITFPLASALAGVARAKEVRGISGFGFSRVYVVFHEPASPLPSAMQRAFYEARTRVLEKLDEARSDLPAGVSAQLGPDATALGQVFAYTIEGPADLGELRSLQDWVVRFELEAVEGVSEVASVGGFEREIQIDLDPDALRLLGASPTDVVGALRHAHRDVGAATVERAGTEEIVRSLGLLRQIADVENTPVGRLGPTGFEAFTAMGAGGGNMASMGSDSTEPDSMDAPGTTAPPSRPVLLSDLATVHRGPAFRRGALADGRGELVGGIVAMRFGENPREVIARLREAVQRLNDPANALLPEGVRLRPFYDRTQLIDETVETLEGALRTELWITVGVVLLFLLHWKSSLLIAASLPLAVLISFLFMDFVGLSSNLMSLTGIAIAIGTMVDMAVVMTENIAARLQSERGQRPVPEIIADAAVEVGPALLTAVATTITSFLPIFFLTDTEGKLFRPLAWTKTFALASAALTGILLIPALCRLFLLGPADKGGPGGASTATRTRRTSLPGALLGALLLGGPAAWLHPFGLGSGVALVLFAILGAFLGRRMARERLDSVDSNPVSAWVLRVYEPSLRWALAHRRVFAILPLSILAFGTLVTLGAHRTLTPLRAVFGDDIDRLRPVAWLETHFEGLGQEFMPPLDEGSLLYMPSLLPQASLSQTMEVMQRQNARFEGVPEVVRVVGKLGRAATPLDPAPVGMVETVLQLAPRSAWRSGLTQDALIQELRTLAHTPGALEGGGAWLQPIETRVLMLQSDVRAPLALRLMGAPQDDEGQGLDARDGVLRLEESATRLRDFLARVPGVAGPNVENLGGKPYLEIDVDRDAAARLGVSVGDVQEMLSTTVGGREILQAFEGRERTPVRVAWPRELRDSRESLEQIWLRGRGGETVALGEIAEFGTHPGPAVIKTQDGRLRLHVSFAASGRDEGSLMEDVLARVQAWRQDEVAAGRPDPIPQGVAVQAAGRYEAQSRAARRFAVLVPICGLVILGLLLLQFRSLATTLNAFAALPVCIAGGLILIWAWPGFQDLLFDLGWVDRASGGPIYITVAVVVGFIAMAGIATDDGVVMCTYLDQVFEKENPTDVAGIREAVVRAGLRRIRPCLMTTMTTLLALTPILLSDGTGSDVARPMALPAVGGMIAELLSLFLVPCVYAAWREGRLAITDGRARQSDPGVLGAEGV